MRIFVVIAISLWMLAPVAHSQTSRDHESIRILRSGSQPSRQGPAENFTGSVRVDPLFQAEAPARASGSVVTFEPGARTAWHTHPLGQILIVTAGTGRCSAGAIRQRKFGGGTWSGFPPGQKHWHGAAANSSMAHIAIVEQLDGKEVEWMEKVSEAQYGALPSDITSSAKPADFALRGTQLLVVSCGSKGNDEMYVITGARNQGPNVVLDSLFMGDGHIQPHQRWSTGFLVDSTQVPQGGAAGRQVYDLSLPFNRNMPTYYFYRQVQDAPFFSIVSPLEKGELVSGPRQERAQVNGDSISTFMTS